MLNIPDIARQLNERAKNYAIGDLQTIRKRLKGLKRKPSRDLFNHTGINQHFAFHHGGRGELQFNIGIDDTSGSEFFRSGVAYSFETSASMRSIEHMKDSVKRFNEYLSMHVQDYSDFSMWHIIGGKRSENYFPRPIELDLFELGNFVFLGSLVRADDVEVEQVLQDFDRLLRIYLYSESGEVHQEVFEGASKSGFQPGNSQKQSWAGVTQEQRRYVAELRHNDLQQTLFDRLVTIHGEDNVGTENYSSTGGKIDLSVRTCKGLSYYEIKVGSNARFCIRQALGQLFEYSYWPGAEKPIELFIVGEGRATADSEQYLDRISKWIGIPISYIQVKL